MKEEIDNSTFTVRDFNIQLPTTDKMKQKISNDVENLKAINQSYLTFTEISTQEQKDTPSFQVHAKH